MVSTTSTLSLLITFGPFLYPRLRAFVQSFRPPPGTVKRPLDPKAKRAIDILTLSFFIFLVASFPYFAPENIFSKTSSRLTIPTDLLFTRLGQLRELSPLDEALKAKFVSLESRLLYLKYGPDVLASCPFCNSEDPLSYFYYALPIFLTPHVLHLVLLGLATSSLIGGAHAGRWRTYATIAGIFMLFMDVCLVYGYDHSENKTATTLGALDFFFWRMRTLRYVGFMVMDVVLGLAIWASSTQRAFVRPKSVAERLDESNTVLERMASRVVAAGVVKDTIIRDMRDDGLFRKTMDHWVGEARAMYELDGQPEVGQAMHNAKSRVSVEEVSQGAKRFVEGMLGDVTVMQPASQPSQ